MNKTIPGFHEGKFFGLSSNVFGAKLILAVSVCLVSVLSISASSGWRLWLFDLSSHFRLQYLAFLCVALPFLVAAKNWKTLAVSTLAIALNLLVVVPVYFPEAVLSQPFLDGPRSAALKVVSININFKNDNFEDAISYIRKENPEVFGVEELTEPCLKVLQARLPEYKYVASALRTDPYGIGMFSRIPLEHVQTLYLGSSVPSINADIDFDGKSISLLVTHPFAPISPDWDAQNFAQMSEIGKFVEQSKKTTLVFGDMNATPWCPSFRSLLTKGNMVDSRIGFGQQASWMRMVPFIAIPIDHFVTTHDLKTLARRVGPFVGSDHWPVCVEVKAVGTVKNAATLSFDADRKEHRTAHRI